MTRTSIAAGCLAALLALTACSSSSNSPGGGTKPASGQSQSVAGPKITIKNFSFTGTLTVKAGAKVTVVNDDSTTHTLTDKTTHKFDTGDIDSGSSGTFTAPDKAGSYPFGCNHHSEMKGTLVVQG